MTNLTDSTVAVLRIELKDIEPLIWRRVVVPTSMNLKWIHSVIQAAMGWLDIHLWEFRANERKFGMRIPNDPDNRINNAATVKLSALLSSGITEIIYVYDIGDNWEHQIVVESVTAAEPAELYPQFLGGERRCPPEDCGGFPGYYEFLDNIASKDSKRRKAALDWYGRPYKPDDIDEAQIVADFKNIVDLRDLKRSKTA
jgi:hypothetical protein